MIAIERIVAAIISFIFIIMVSVMAEGAGSLGSVAPTSELWLFIFWQWVLGRLDEIINAKRVRIFKPCEPEGVIT